ncbi:hypothetical protein PG987_006487 [Apiospora arundinis]
MPVFPYSPIDLSRDAIRIVRLYQRKRQRTCVPDIRCELIETFLSALDGVPYEALSYTWGGDPLAANGAQIVLNDRKVSVTPNLFEALMSLRLPDRDRILWVDALCIDQANDQEKGHQVGQMRLVYQHAESVLIWLGPSSNQVKYTMEMMTILDNRAMQHSDYKKHPLQILSKESSDLKLGSDCDVATGFKYLLARPWFQRVWVLQEVACARSATVVCGMHAVSSRTFAFMPSLLEGQHWGQQINAKAVLELMPGPMRIESWFSEDRTLATLLKKFEVCQASVQLDRIYALLGISSDASDPQRFPPTYSLTMRELLQNTISFLLFGRIPENPAAEINHLYIEQLPDWEFSELVDILRKPGPFWMYIFDWSVDNYSDDLILGLVHSGVFDAHMIMSDSLVAPATVLAYKILTDLQPPPLDEALGDGEYSWSSPETKNYASGSLQYREDDIRTLKFNQRLVDLRSEVSAIASDITQV